MDARVAVDTTYPVSLQIRDYRSENTGGLLDRCGYAVRHPLKVLNDTVEQRRPGAGSARTRV